MLFNRPRAIDYMHQCGVDVLIATSPVNITYFTDYVCWLDPLFKEYMTRPGAPSDLFQAYAVFPLEGPTALVVNPLFAVNADDLWVDELVAFGDLGLDFSHSPATLPQIANRSYEWLRTAQHAATATEALLGVLTARRLTTARIGFEADGMSSRAKSALEKALPHATLKDCSNLIRLIRMVKSQTEIDRLARAAEISEIAAMESLALAQPARSVRDLIQCYREGISRLGADFDHFAFAINGLGIATEPEYTLTPDDVLYVDFGCRYGGYFSDSGTTLAMRELSGILHQRFTAIRASMDAGISEIRAGVRASAVRGAMYQTMVDQGITATNPHGHGFGLDVRDYPIIVADNGLRIRDDCVDVPSDLPLEPDMVINLEAPVFMPGVGSVHLEQSFVVTETGSRPLVTQDRARPVTAT